VTTSNLPLAASGERAALPTKRRVLRRIVGYALARGTTEVLLAIRGVLLAILLGPAAFGTWALLRLVMRYSSLVGLSVYRGLELELLQSRRTPEQPHASAPAALGFVLLVSGGIAAAALGASFLVEDAFHRMLLRGFAAASLAEALYGYALVCTRIRGNLRVYSLLESGTALLHLGCAVAFASIWGLSGAFLGLTIANLLGIVAARRWLELRPTIDLQSVGRMLEVGFPVVLSIAAGIMLATGDRWVVALWGGPTMLGYYAFAGSVTTVAGALAMVVRTVVFPQVYGDASSNGAAAALQSHMQRALMPFARLLPPLLGALSLALGPLVAAAVPSYHAAIAPGRVFLLAGVAMGLVNLASIGAVAAGRQRQLPLYAGSALAVTFALSIVALGSGYGLGSVAAATFAGHLMFDGLVLRLNAREAGIPESGRFVVTILLPLAWCTAAVGLVGQVVPGLDARSTATAFVLYLFLLVPLIPGWQREWRRIAELTGNLTSRQKKS
jgi:O-antigen/teichoic acid export membrane protein